MISTLFLKDKITVLIWSIIILIVYLPFIIIGQDSHIQIDYNLICIINEKQEPFGLITDGDLRRKLLKVQKPFSTFFIDDALVHAKQNPITCRQGDNLKEVVQLMGEKQIWDLPIVDQENQLVGLLHLHPAIKKLIN